MVFMYLLMNLSDKNNISLALFDETVVSQREWPAPNRDLLAMIESFLSAQGLTKNEVKGIMVVVGAGGFTSTRIATTIANTFGYVQQIPLLAVTKDQVNKVQELIPKLRRQPRGQYISATYSGEPNIGVRRN